MAGSNIPSSLQQLQPNPTVKAQLFASLKCKTPLRRDSSLSSSSQYSDKHAACDKSSLEYPGLESGLALGCGTLSHSEFNSHARGNRNSIDIGGDSMIQVDI